MKAIGLHVFTLWSCLQNAPKRLISDKGFFAGTMPELMRCREANHIHVNKQCVRLQNKVHGLHFLILCLLLEYLRRSPSMWHEAGTWCPISSTVGNNHVSTFSTVRNAGETCMKPGPDLGRTGPESLAAWTDFSRGFWFELVSRVFTPSVLKRVKRYMIAFIQGN